jgi:PAS domain S-box-containing protein
MDLDSRASKRVPASLRVPRLALTAVVLLAAHITLLILFGHSTSIGAWSDELQLALVVFASVVCFHTGRRSTGIARPFWYLTGASLATWSLGKCLVLYGRYYLGHTALGFTPVLLYFLCVAPLFVAVFISNDDFVGGINWEWLLDATQIFGLIFIIYLFLIYVPLVSYGERFVSPIEDRLLLWRNLLLTAGLLIRGLASRPADIQRLYLPMSGIIGVFSMSTWIANRAQEASSAPETAWYDLAWSIPFCLIALDASFWQDSAGRIGAPLKLPSLSRVILVFLPSLILPVMLLVKYRALLREQLFLGLFGLIFSIILFNVRLMVTQRRQRLTLKALHASEYQYRSLFERNMAGVFRSTVDGKLLDCNPAFANMFGYSREELMGIPLYELYFGGKEERSKWISSLRTESRTVPGEHCFRRKDGTTLWAVLNSNVDNQSPGAELLEGTLVDVTERRALEGQLRQAQKMEAMGRLAGGVAHDFNNLLTIICGYSAIQIERTNPSDPVHHEAEQIKAAADRAAALTRQLLAFSRQQVLQPRPINLNDTVRSVDKMLRRLIGEDIEIATVLAADLGTVEADPGQIDMVLMNLAVNSRDAMPQGGKLTIQTENVELDENYIQTHSHVVPGRYILLAVSDNGTGIAPETQARIFEPFFTTKEAGKGTGLGLPGVYGIVKQSGGSIEVYSELNHGTTIKMYFPRVDAIAEKVPLPAKQSSGKRGSERILLVEDDCLVRGLAVDILKAQGYTVRAIERPEEIGTILQESESFDLLLTDVVMPKMSGPEVANQVASRWPRIKVLYISGYTRNALVQQTLLEKDLPFLQKPFTPAVLSAKVREVLDAEGNES